MSSFNSPPPRSESRPPFRVAGEPPLDEVLEDPIIHRLMERDGVPMTVLLALIAAVQRHSL